MIDHILDNISVYWNEVILRMNIAEKFVSILAILVIIHGFILLAQYCYKRRRKNNKCS